MIVAKKEYIPTNISVYGNYALDNEKYNEENEADVALKKNRKLKHKKQMLLRIKMVVGVTIVFLTGIMIISRYATITNLKNQTIDMKKVIALKQKETDDLQLQLMKHYDIKEIEKVATTELNMLQPGKSNNAKIPVNVDKETKNTAVDSSQNDEVNLIDKLKNAFSFIFSKGA